MDLKGISTKMKALTDLLTIMTTGADVSLEQIKSIAAERGTETNILSILRQIQQKAGYHQLIKYL